MAIVIASQGSGTYRQNTSLAQAFFVPGWINRLTGIRLWLSYADGNTYAPFYNSQIRFRVTGQQGQSLGHNPNFNVVYADVTRNVRDLISSNQDGVAVTIGFGPVAVTPGTYLSIVVTPYLNTGDAAIGCWANGSGVGGGRANVSNPNNGTSWDGIGALRYVVYGYGPPEQMGGVSISSVQQTQFSASSSIGTENGATITERGFLYSAGTSNPLMSNSTKKIVGSGAGSFSTSITGLTPNTQYWVRSYAYNAGGLSYGSVNSTTTANYNPATVSNDVSFTVGASTLPINISNSGNYYVNARILIGSTTVRNVNLGQVSGSNNLTMDSGVISSIYSEMANVTSAGMSVVLRSYTDSGYSNQVGGNQVKNGTATINQSINLPIFTTYTISNIDKSVEVKDKYNNTLVTSSTSTLLGSDDKVISGFSKVRAVITEPNKMVAQNSATPVKYRLVGGSLNAEANYSDVSTVNMDLDNVTTKDFSLSAIDSRNLSTSVAQSLAYVAPFVPIALSNVQIKRDNSIDTETKLSFTGQMWKGYFGSGTSGVENTVTAHYRFKEATDSWGSQTWEEITVGVDGNGVISFNDYIDGDLGGNGFNNEKSYSIEVRIFDALSQRILEGVLDKGIPNVHFHNQGTAFGAMYDETLGGTAQVTGELYKNAGKIIAQWERVSEVWTRTGNHTFTVTGNLTAKYRLCTKVRYRDGGSDEYGVIGEVSHSSGTTTISLIANDDFTMEATAITDTFISYADNPEGFPNAFNWAGVTTLVWAGGTTDPTTSNILFATWRVTGGMIFFKARIDVNARGSGNRTEGRLPLPLPIGSQTSRNFVMGSMGENLLQAAVTGKTAYFQVQGGGYRLQSPLGGAMSQSSGSILTGGWIGLDPNFE